eukprot:gene21329-25616_t
MASSRQIESAASASPSSNQGSLENVSIDSILASGAFPASITTPTASDPTEETNMTSSEVDSEMEEQMINDSLSDMPNITLPALPGDMTSSTRSLSPFSNTSFTSLPTATTQSLSTQNLPPLPSTSVSLPPVVSPSSPPPAAAPKLAPTNSLLSFCSFVIQTTPNVEPSAVKKPTSPISSPKSDRHDNTSSEVSLPSLTSSAGEIAILLPEIKSISIPSIEQEHMLPSSPVSVPKKPESKRFTQAFPSGTSPIAEPSIIASMKPSSNIVVGLNKQTPPTTTTTAVTNKPTVAQTKTPLPQPTMPIKPVNNTTPTNTPVSPKSVPVKQLPPPPPKKTLPPLPTPPQPTGNGGNPPASISLTSSGGRIPTSLSSSGNRIPTTPSSDPTTRARSTMDIKPPTPTPIQESKSSSTSRLVGKALPTPSPTPSNASSSTPSTSSLTAPPLPPKRSQTKPAPSSQPQASSASDQPPPPPPRRAAVNS